MESSWASPIFRETALIVLGLLFVSAVIVYFFRNTTHYFKVSWVSLKSWLIAAPLLFVAMGAAAPWPLLAITLLAILGARAFFQMMGMYHRSYFVMSCYFGIVALGYAVHVASLELYNLMPMIILAVICCIPLILNAYERMIQYIALTLLCFIFLGWSFMHLGWIIRLEHGIYQMMYLLILTEFCDNTNLAISRTIGRTKLVKNITTRRTVEATAVSVALTIALAFAMHHLLPDDSESYWLLTGLTAALVGVVGDLVLAVIRRDLGIRITGAFIIGRGDFLRRMDRLIFVAPIYYYLITNMGRLGF